jgi:hypothetical protein
MLAIRALSLLGLAAVLYCFMKRLKLSPWSRPRNMGWRQVIEFVLTMTLTVLVASGAAGLLLGAFLLVRGHFSQ